MEKKNRLEKTITNVVKIIFISIIAMLMITSIFSTSSMKKDEHTQYEADNPIIQIGCITVFCVFVTYIQSRKDKIKITRKKMIVGIIIWLIICTTWIFITQLEPRADQKELIEAAMQIKEKNFSSLEEGGYLYKNPHQFGMTLYLYILTYIFGKHTYLVVQVINIFAILIAFYSMHKISLILYKNKNMAKITLISLFLFIPISMYITFIYGNLLGFACSILAVLFELMYLNNEKKRYIFAMAVLISLAILFKSNYMITMIAMFILFIIEIILKKRIKLIFPIAIVIIFYLISGNFINFIMKTMSEKQINQGTPMLSYVAMGLQEGKLAPGWYNGYTQKIYKEGKYDYAITTEKIKTNINKSLNNFKNNPKYTLQFFSQKVTSQWNNPTFQCFWIHTRRKSDLPKQKIVKSILGTGKVNMLLTQYMNIIQTLILFGTVMYIVLEYKKIKLNQLLFAIIFIGGFLFHLVWEAKCQYTITYFVLLIPYAVLGYMKISEKILIFYNKKIKKLKYLETKDIISKTEE